MTIKYSGEHDFTTATVTGISGGGGTSVTIDADGTLVVDGTTVEVATDAQLTAGLATKSDTGHAHAASEITSGVLAIARLATGTPDGTKFIRDDGALAAPAGAAGFKIRPGYWRPLFIPENTTWPFTLNDEYCLGLMLAPQTP